MHQPESNQFAYIDQVVFDALRRTRPVYEDAPNVVIVDPETFEATPKLREPRIRTAEELERIRAGRATATTISRLRHKARRRK